MRRMWDNKKFFSFYEHLEPSQIEEIFMKTAPIMNKQPVPGELKIPYVGFLVKRHPALEETLLNHIIGIA